MDGIIHTGNENYVLSKDSHMKLTLPSSSSSSMQRSPLIKKVIFKDERLDYLDIPKGLVEVLQSNGFTVEEILDCGPSHIAEILGIDDYIGEIIYQETKKATRNIISNSNF